MTCQRVSTSCPMRRVRWSWPCSMRVESKLEVVAHLSESIPRFWFIDNSSLQGFLANELDYGLRIAVEAKVLAEINGTSGTQAQAYATSSLATLRKSLTKLEAAGYDPGFSCSIPPTGRVSNWRWPIRMPSITKGFRMTLRHGDCSVCRSSCPLLRLRGCHTRWRAMPWCWTPTPEARVCSGVRTLAWTRSPRTSL